MLLRTFLVATSKEQIECIIKRSLVVSIDAHLIGVVVTHYQSSSFLLPNGAMI